MSHFDLYDPLPQAPKSNIISSIISYFMEPKNDDKKLTLSDLFLQLDGLTNKPLTLRQPDDVIFGYMYRNGSVDLMTKNIGLVNVMMNNIDQNESIFTIVDGVKKIKRICLRGTLNYERFKLIMEFNSLYKVGDQFYPDAICICGFYVGNRYEQRIELFADCLLC